MYDVESGKLLYEGFIRKLKTSVKGLKEEIATSSKNKPLFEALAKYSQTGDVSLLYPYKESSLLSSEVRDAIRKLEFLQRHNITSAPQYVDAKGKIDGCEETKTAPKRIQQINVRVENAQRKIEINEKAISGEADSVQLGVAIKSIGLSPADQIEVLKFLIHEECQKESTKKSQIADKQMEDRSTAVAELKDEINATIEELSKFISDNYHYIDGQSREQLRLKSMVAFAMQDDKGEVDVTQIKDAKEYLQVLLISLFDEKANLTDTVNEELANSSSDEELALIRGINDDVKKKLGLGYELVTAVEETNKEKEEAEPSNIVILNDAEGKPVVDIESFEGNVWKSVDYIVKKLEKGQYDYAKGLKHSRLLTDDSRIKDTIYVNRKDGIACSYIRLTDDMVLVLACDSVRNIYDKSKRTYIENKDTIEDMVNLARNDIDGFKDKYVQPAHTSKGGK